MERSLFNKQFVVDGSDSERYAEAVNNVRKLVKRPYMQMHNIFTEEKWTIEEIERTYQNATKHNGDIPSPVMFWYLRKKRNAV